MGGAVESVMTDRHMNATIGLALSAVGGPKEDRRWSRFRRSDAERERMAVLAGAVDRKSYWRYVAIGGALGTVILLIAMAICLLTLFGPWAVIRLGLIEPGAIESHPWLTASVYFVIFVAGALAATIAMIIVPARLAAPWAASMQLRARLVPEPGDAALLAKCERAVVVPILLASPLVFLLLPLAILLVRTTSQWLAQREWILLSIVLLAAATISQLIRRSRGRP
jgi:hypothetical protein